MIDDDFDFEYDETTVPAKISQKILSTAKKQQDVYFY